MVATSTPTPTPPEPPTQQRGPNLVMLTLRAEALRALDWRPWFRELDVVMQEQKAMELARHIALSRSDLGLHAAEVSFRFDQLIQSIGAFLAGWRDPADTEAAARQTLEASGLLVPVGSRSHNYDGYHSNHYREVHATVEALGVLLNVLCPSLDDLDPPRLEYGPAVPPT